MKLCFLKPFGNAVKICPRCDNIWAMFWTWYIWQCYHHGILVCDNAWPCFDDDMWQCSIVFWQCYVTMFDRVVTVVCDNVWTINYRARFNHGQTDRQTWSASSSKHVRSWLKTMVEHVSIWSIMFWQSTFRLGRSGWRTPAIRTQKAHMLCVSRHAPRQQAGSNGSNDEFQPLAWFLVCILLYYLWYLGAVATRGWGFWRITADACGMQFSHSQDVDIGPHQDEKYWQDKYSITPD